MKIIFTGKSDFTYNRTFVLLEGLRQLENVEVVVYPITKRGGFDKREFGRLQEDAEFIYIPPFRHRDVGFIKKQASIPVVFDPLISKYLTKDDFGQIWKKPFKYLLDKIPFSRCDILIADTQHHKEYFSQTFGIPEEKIFVLPIGADTSLFYPAPQPQNEKFVVGFYGNFVPLQGTDKIIETAHILRHHKDIVFDIVGSGYRLKSTLKLASKLKLNNVKFIGNVPYSQLNGHINQFDICLGIFGDSLKADLVIPNKIYHYAAAGKCIITKDTEGIREIFTHDHNIVLTQNSPQKIAETILRCKANTTFARQIGENALKTISTGYNARAVAQIFVDILKTNGRI